MFRGARAVWFLSYPPALSWSLLSCLDCTRKLFRTRTTCRMFVRLCLLRMSLAFPVQRDRSGHRVG